MVTKFVIAFSDILKKRAIRILTEKPPIQTVSMDERGKGTIQALMGR